MSGLTISRANKFVNVKKSVLTIPVAALSSKQQQQLKNVVLQIVKLLPYTELKKVREVLPWIKVLMLYICI